ncbi:hypothetical protein H311_03656, partial [Anncaliia algerae PRA109]
SREDLEKLEEYYIEIISKLIKIAEDNRREEATLVNQSEIRILRRHTYELENELENIFNDALGYFNTFDGHFTKPEMKAYLWKMKADFLRSKAKTFGIQNLKNAISLAISYYKTATSLLETNSWLCPYKLDVFFNFLRLKTLLDPSDIHYDVLTDKYEFAFLNSDSVKNDWKYFNDILRSMNVFLNKKRNVHEVTLEALICNNYQSEFMHIVSRKEYLKSYYFF